MNKTHKNLTAAFAGAAVILATAGATLTVLSTPAQAQAESALSEYVSPEAPPTYDQPGQAVDAFKAALAANDFDGLAKLLGLDPVKLRTSEGVTDTFNQMRLGATEQVVIDDKGDTQVIELGKQLWPMPFPIAKGDDGKWSFDTYAGIQEVVDRRVGENETEAVATLRALVEAQRDYYEDDHDGDGVLEYAQNLISTPGTTDGLYWPADQGDGESPAGSIPDESQLDKIKAGDGYYGYRFRILKGQGDNVAGGKYDYVINDNMIAGFAVVAWPVTYTETGVHTFLVSKEGIVYEADLDADTDAKARAMDQFDPDRTWVLVED